MKRNLLITVFTLLLLSVSGQPTFAQESEPFSRDQSPLSKPSSPVMDYAGVIDGATKQRLEATVKEFSETSNPPVEIGVAVVKTTGDVPIFDYSLAVARGWGIGSREDDNPGLLLLVAVEDRKYFTQVSKDLEDELPDGIVGSLQRQYLVPPFKQGNYAKGIEDTIDAFIRTIEERRNGETPPPSGTTSPTESNDDFENSIGQICQILGCLFVIFIFVMFAVNNSKKSKPDKNDKDRWGGGGGGSGGGTSAGVEIALTILGALLSGSGGGGSSSSSDWGSGGSSSWGGGSSGGWGGFGGGGDFGGGGSGGSW